MKRQLPLSSRQALVCCILSSHPASAMRPGMILNFQPAGRRASNAVEMGHPASNAVKKWHAELRIGIPGSRGLPARCVHLA